MEIFSNSCNLKLQIIIGLFVLQNMVNKPVASSDCSPIVNTIDRIRCTGPNLKNITRNAKALIVNGIPSNPIGLYKINRSIFTGLNLTEIFISFTDLTDVDEDSFQDLKQLRRIVLKNNKIGKIHKGTFHGLKFLEMIDLSGNEYCSIESGAFSGLNSLRHLYLGNMKLGSLDESSFQGLNSLIDFDLHGNNLQHLTNSIISSFPKLQSLDLTSNNLKTLSKDLKPALTRLRHVSLSDNPWQCNCDLEWMKNSTILTVTENRQHYFDMIICYGPSSLRYRSLIDVPRSEMPCIPPKIIQCGGPYEVTEGRNLRLHCEAKGDPFPDFIWQSPSGLSINSNNQTDRYVTMDNGTLLILAASLHVNGHWTVLAHNNAGNDSSSFEVHVQKKNNKNNEIYLIAGGVGAGTLLTAVTIIVCCFYHGSKNKISPRNNNNKK